MTREEKRDVLVTLRECSFSYLIVKSEQLCGALTEYLINVALLFIRHLQTGEIGMGDDKWCESVKVRIRHCDCIS